MRPLMIVVFLLAIINVIFAILNLTVVPQEYRMYGNIVISVTLVTELICASIICHSPLKDLK